MSLQTRHYTFFSPHFLIFMNTLTSMSWSGVEAVSMTTGGLNALMCTCGMLLASMGITPLCWLPTLYRQVLSHYLADQLDLDPLAERTFFGDRFARV